MSDGCRATLFMYDGEYEGFCELADDGHTVHWDGLTTWRTDENGWPHWDAIDLPEEREKRRPE